MSSLTTVTCSSPRSDVSGMEEGHGPDACYRRRSRKQNFSHLETSMIMKKVEKHIHILLDKNTDKETNLAKHRIMWEITEAVNSLGESKRTIQEVKDKWRNLKQTAKREIAAFIEAQNKGMAASTQQSLPVIAPNQDSNSSVIEVKVECENYEKDTDTGSNAEEEKQDGPPQISSIKKLLDNTPLTSSLSPRISSLGPWDTRCNLPSVSSIRNLVKQTSDCTSSEANVDSRLSVSSAPAATGAQSKSADFIPQNVGTHSRDKHTSEEYNHPKTTKSFVNHSRPADYSSRAANSTKDQSRVQDSLSQVTTSDSHASCSNPNVEHSQLDVSQETMNKLQYEVLMLQKRKLDLEMENMQLMNKKLKMEISLLESRAYAPQIVLNPLGGTGNTFSGT
ncbi:t-SNARE domain-containing protein 1 [Lingula anatina]|uniref:t-SNARE domain-containing protein 1 n=1 Tax=Lingula anatina TaxID=7574 RepID=A0A1S3K0G0_LINAN|nr:t-SNARE domain-containing protein 1 [Lingula anatina]|eukprot:XP_013415849.1 t-SNARE domain-containing protein 1 [Lingula anatina]